jgi:DNA polymerase III subunit delta
VNGTPTALLVCGNEEYLRARIIRDFTHQLSTAYGDLSPRHADATDLNSQQIQELLSPELFGGMPLAHISTGNKLDKKALAALVGAIHDPDCAFIVEIPKPAEAGGKAVITALNTTGVHYANITPPKNANDRRNFARTEMRNAGLRASAEAEGVLADGEGDLRGIATRARQLFDDHSHPDAPNPTISAEHVASVATNSTINGFAVADALVARNARAITLTTRDALAAGAAPLLIQAACLIALRDLAQVHTGRTNKMPPWKAQKVRGHARSWDSASVARAIHEMGVVGETVRSSSNSENALLAALLRAAR